MASDEIVWQVINQQFCSYKLKYNHSLNLSKAALTDPLVEPPKNKHSAATSIMSLASATANRAHSPIQTMPLSDLHPKQVFSIST